MLKLNSYWLEEDLWKKLKRLVHSLNLDKNISFVGYINRGKLLEYYQNATIFVHTSYHEGLPTTIIEAMSCGIPVIATKVAGTSEIIRNSENGFLVPPKNPEKLATAILSLLNEKELRGRMGKNTDEYVKRNFNWDIIVKKFEEMYINMMR